MIQIFKNCIFETLYYITINNMHYLIYSIIHTMRKSTFSLTALLHLFQLFFQNHVTIFYQCLKIYMTFIFKHNIINMIQINCKYYHAIEFKWFGKFTVKEIRKTYCWFIKFSVNDCAKVILILFEDTYVWKLKKNLNTFIGNSY